jgi:flagellar M-ring protein FliF
VGLSGSMLEYQRTLEADAERKIVRALGRTVGPDKVVASVTADVNFAREVKQAETYDSENPAVRSRQTVEESEQGNESNENGVAGAAANLPDNPGETSKVTSNNQALRKTQAENYEISSVHSETVSPAGSVDRLSIAVLVDGKYVPVEGEVAAGAQKTKYVPWEPAELEQFKSLAMSAVGFDKKRGDQIEVINMSFRGQETFSEEVFAEQPRDWVTLGIKWGGIFLGSILFFFLVLRPLIQWLTTEEVQISDEAMEMLLPGRVGDVEDRLLGRGGVAVEDIEETTDHNDELAEMRQQIQDRRRVAIENARRDRKAITLMIRKWLKEDHDSRKAEAQREANA